MLLRLMARVEVLCSSAEVVGGRMPGHAQHDEREIEAHDEAVIPVDARHERAR